MGTPPKESSLATLELPARRRLSRVLRRADLQATVRAAQDLGLKLWLVGGAPGNALLGRPVAEVDLAVSAAADRLVEAMTTAGLGRGVLLFDEVPRTFRVAGTHDFDIAEITGGSIETDLARRDFTVNAMALALPTGELLDPFGGTRDLARGRLRAVSDRNLLDDPLRVLRAARLMATHGLKPVGALADGARAAAGGLAHVARERVRAELTKLFAAERSAAAVLWLRAAGALAPALRPSPSDPAKMPFARGLALLDRPPVRKSRPSSRVRIRLGLIARLAGLSPPETAQWLKALRFGRSEAGDVAKLLELSSRAARIRSRREEWEWIRDAGALRSDAALLASLLQPSLRGLQRRLARPLRPRRVRVSGGDLMAWLGLTPGPPIGRLLREIEIEILRGTVRSRRQARQWLLERQRDDAAHGQKVEGRMSKP